MKAMWIAVVLLGCADGKGGEFADCDADGLSGVGQATVDGIEWTASDGTWMEAGSAVQVNFQSGIDISLNLRGTRSQSGAAVADAVAEDAFPVVIDLGGVDGSGSIFDQRHSPKSYASSQPGGEGSMSILERDGSALILCFDFDAVDASGVIMTVRGGKGRVTNLEP